MPKSPDLQDLKNKTAAAVDKRVRAITAGLGLNELRALITRLYPEIDTKGTGS